MSKWTFIPNNDGFRELRNSAEMQSLLKSYGERVMAKASSSGGAYGCNTRAGATRAHTRVYTRDAKAVRDNLKNNTLLKAMGGGR